MERGCCCCCGKLPTPPRSSQTPLPPLPPLPPTAFHILLLILYQLLLLFFLPFITLNMRTGGKGFQCLISDHLTFFALFFYVFESRFYCCVSSLQDFPLSPLCLLVLASHILLPQRLSPYFYSCCCLLLPLMPPLLLFLVLPPPAFPLPRPGALQTSRGGEMWRCLSQKFLPSFVIAHAIHGTVFFALSSQRGDETPGMRL